MRNPVKAIIICTSILSLPACQTTTTATSSAALPAGVEICSDFKSRKSCGGKRYEIVLPYGTFYEHRGIDFVARPGTPVISSVEGSVDWAGYQKCGGGSVRVRASFRVSDPKFGDNTRVLVSHNHLRLREGIRRDVNLKPGDVIGYIAEAHSDDCVGSVPHVHLQMNAYSTDQEALNPNEYWVDGPGQVTCFRDGMTVPNGKIVAPLRCG